MAKLAPTSIKYVIRASIKADGVVEKPDVIGAVFGQTEGLLGSELDLRELQRTGKIGRIEVNIKSEGGKSEGEIVIPSALDSAETALIAAAIETVERVGPCSAEIKLIGIEDVRASKREYVLDRAKSILKELMESSSMDIEEISEQIKESVRALELSTYHGLPCGPNIAEADEIIVVEGRADVLNLLKHGIRNVIAIGGTSIPPTITDLSKEKTVTVFVDGDRGGQLIAREMLQKADVDFIAIAPDGKEVEELTKKEIFKALRSKMTAEQFKIELKNHRFAKRERKQKRWRMPKISQDQKELFLKTLDELVGTRAACILNEKGELLGKVPVNELASTLRTLEKPHTVIFDGKVTPQLALIAKHAGVRYLVGMEREDFISSIAVLSRRDLEK